MEAKGDYHPHPAATGDLPRVVTYTDGSCLPPAGGWAAIMRFGEHEKELVGSERGEHVTNNRMEITAALEALFACKNPVDMTIHSDSKYLGNCWHLWLPGWVRKGWVTAGKKPQPVANQDLWRAMLLASRVHTFRFVHVKGHNGDVLNERCDRLAGDARVKAMDAPSPDYESTGQAIVKRMLGVDLAVA